MKKYLVIGNPVEHSLSPKLHNYWIKKNNLDAVYNKQQPNKNDIEGIINEVKNGKIDGVVYVDKDGNQQKQKARIVAVAGNSIETPRLLLMSNTSMYPDGLSNSAGQVGKNYMRHLTASVYALMDKPVNMHRGTTMAGIITDESRNDPSRGFVGGYEDRQGSGDRPGAI